MNQIVKESDPKKREQLESKMMDVLSKAVDKKILTQEEADKFLNTYNKAMAKVKKKPIRIPEPTDENLAEGGKAKYGIAVEGQEIGKSVTVDTLSDSFLNEQIKFHEDVLNRGVTSPASISALYILKAEKMRRERLGLTYIGEPGEAKPFKTKKKAPEVVEGQGTIDFEAHSTTSYVDRTSENARKADATIAIFIDPNTPGAKATKREVSKHKNEYIALSLDPSVSQSDFIGFIDTSAQLVNKLNSTGSKTLNIAGSGIYNLKGEYTQEELDTLIFEFLEKVVNDPDLKNPIESIRTGGQTGVDEAGAKAGMRLGIPVIILSTKDWKFRDITGKDIKSEEKFKARFKDFIEAPTKKTPEAVEDIPIVGAEDLIADILKDVDPEPEQGFSEKDLKDIKKDSKKELDSKKKNDENRSKSKDSAKKTATKIDTIVKC